MNWFVFDIFDLYDCDYWIDESICDSIIVVIIKCWLNWWNNLFLIICFCIKLYVMYFILFSFRVKRFCVRNVVRNIRLDVVMKDIKFLNIVNV